MRIFVRDRRDDSGMHARLLQREMSGCFGADSVFMAFEGIGWGDSVAERIDKALARAVVGVVVTGPR